MSKSGPLVPKFYLGTPPDPREAARIGEFPSTTWERGNRWFAAFIGLAILSLTHAAAAPQPDLQSIIFHGQGYSIRTVDPQKEDLRLFYKDDEGHLLKDFAGLEEATAAKGEKVLFAANAGMFEPDMRPVGLLVQNGSETAPLNLNDAPGNFYMKPNGVFLINAKHEARVIESSEYLTLLTPAVLATQSGPLLVHAGAIHPDFNPESKSIKIRSGVGVRADGTIVFALSRAPVTFYDFASFFLTKMKCPNALFLDGDISAFYAPDRKDAFPHNFGPMIGIVQKSH